MQCEANGKQTADITPIETHCRWASWVNFKEVAVGCNIISFKTQAEDLGLGGYVGGVQVVKLGFASIKMRQRAPCLVVTCIPTWKLHRSTSLHTEPNL